MNIERLEMLEKRLREMDPRLWSAGESFPRHIEGVGDCGCMYVRLNELWPNMISDYYTFLGITENQAWELFDISCKKALAGRTQYDAADDIRKLINTFVG